MELAATFETFLWTMERQLELYQYVKSLNAVVLQSYFLCLWMIDAFVPGFRTQRYKKLVISWLFIQKNNIFWKNVSSVSENIYYCPTWEYIKWDFWNTKIYLSCVPFISLYKWGNKVYNIVYFQGGCHTVNFSWLHNHILSKGLYVFWVSE